MLLSSLSLRYNEWLHEVFLSCIEEPKEGSYLHFLYTCQEALLHYTFYLWSFDIFPPHQLYDLISCLWVLTEQNRSS